jgi:DNA-binding transcriptional MocR family regulator
MISVKIKKNSGEALYVQIRNAIEKAIKNGELKVGEQLPAVTTLASNIGVTHATIRRAFADLSSNGLIGSHVGRGTFVLDKNKQPLKGESNAPLKNVFPDFRTNGEFNIAARRLRMGIDKSLEAMMELFKKPGLIQFTSGMPDPALIEEGVLTRLTREALKRGEDKYYLYGESPLGLKALREELAKRFNAEGMEITAENILITNGSQQAASILAQSALENRQRIICETPCWLGIPRAFGAIGHWVETATRDRDGIIIEKLERFNDGHPTLLYLCPEFHHPMGTDLTLERQTQLINWAKMHHVDLLADEIFHDLRFEGPLRKSIFTEADNKNCFVMGSLSKSFMVGLRIGWLIGNEERINGLCALKRALDLGSPPIMHGIAFSLLRSGEYDVHLKKAREHYKMRRDVMIESLNKNMPEDVTWTMPNGGYHMWVELPKGYSSIALFLHAIERGVSFLPGPMQDIDHRFINAFRLSYSGVTPEQIKTGIKALGEAVKELLTGDPSEPGLSGLGDFL